MPWPSQAAEDSDAEPITDCVIEIQAATLDSFSVSLRLTLPDSSVTQTLLRAAPLQFDDAKLLASASDDTYDSELARQFFAHAELRGAWEEARATASRIGSVLRVRIHLRDEAEVLHRVYWERLQGNLIASLEQIYVSRYVESSSPVAVALDAAELQTLVFVANPTNLSSFQLSAIDVPVEVSTALEALRPGSVTIIGAHAQSVQRRASRQALIEALRAEYTVLYLVCHGTLDESGEPFLWLEAADGTAQPVAASELIAEIEPLTRLPLLIVLASCFGAGDGHERAFMALGPRLARAGVPAVLAMQGRLQPTTLRACVPVLLSELLRNGAVDRALAAARAELWEQNNWWQPVLFSRLKDNRIWAGARLRARSSEPDNDFIDRRDELFAFQKLLAFATPARVLTIKEERGMGKSRLLQQFKLLAIEQQLPVALVDFKNRSDSLPLAIAEQVYNQLIDRPFLTKPEQAFKHYRELRHPSPQPWSESVGSVSEERAAREAMMPSLRLAEYAMPRSLQGQPRDAHDVLRVFLADLYALCADSPTVLLFDTYEGAGEVVRTWVKESLVQHLFRNPKAPPATCLLVIAGTQTPVFGATLSTTAYRDLIYPMTGLSRWSVYDVAECLQLHGVVPSRENVQFFHRKLREGKSTFTVVSMIQLLRGSAG
jgi:hypothetical protein